MNKIYTCYYCKEKILDEEELIEFEMGKTKITKVRAHINCRKENTEREELYKYFCRLLEIPHVEGKENALVRKNFKDFQQQYTFDMIKHAITEKSYILKDKFGEGKPFPYLTAIIRNQLPYSFNKLKKVKVEKAKTIKESNMEEIFVRPPTQLEIIEKEIEF